MVISDFAYADVAFDGYKPPSFLASPGASEVGVEFTTMSKGYNMAGWRVGFCAGNSEMIRALATIKAYYDYGMFQVDSDRRDHGPASYRCGGGRAIAHLSGPARRAVSTAYDGSVGISPRRKPACSSGPRFPSMWISKMSTMDFAMMLLEEGDVAVSPGSGFGPAGEGYLRMALVENENRLRQAVRQIGQCLKSESRAD